MKLYSYAVPRDYGFAPNPFYGACTLAACKPLIRKTAEVGDWVIGTGSKAKPYLLEGRLVYAMKVSEILDFDEYWTDARFRSKRPYLRGSLMQAFGDNIYHRDSDTGEWIQENSHHTFKDGSPNFKNVKRDTGSSSNVLVSTDYVYWGGSGPTIPNEFRDFDGFDICHNFAGHKCRFPEGFVSSFAEWIYSLDETGYAGAPAEWE